MPLLEPKEQTFDNPDGSKSTFVLSKFPAVAGRRIVAKYPLSAVPKLGDYEVNEATMLELMAFVGVPREGAEPLQLTTQALVNSHCKSWETLARVEMAMMEYNCSFFGNGKASSFFEAIARQAQLLISKTLTDLSAQLSGQDKPR
jgi:hypothetical protein